MELRFAFTCLLTLTLTAAPTAGRSVARGDQSQPDTPRTILVDTKRRTSDATWTPRETTTLALLEDFTPSEVSPETDAFGGILRDRRKATGFFYTTRIGGRAWIIDPNGYPWYAIGCCSVRMSDTARGRTALRAKYGDHRAWASATVDLLHASGFNHLGCWADHETLTAAKKIPYTVQLNLLSRFGKSLDITYQKPGHTGYPNDCMPVFHPGFEDFCARAAREQIGDRRDDPYLLGYFSDNELPLRVSALDRYLQLDADDPGRKAAEAWLATREIEPTDKGFDMATRTAFLEYVADRYYSVTTKAIRAADPNHMCLGSRLHGSDLRREVVFRACGRYCDIVAVNCYGVWTHDPQRLADWARWSGRPFLVTEWYAKGMDSGMKNLTGAGWTVRTQRDRGRFYQNFTLGLLACPDCVGWHWFKYMDNDPTSTTADPSNLDSNKGFLTNQYEPYHELLEMMEALNDQAYALVDYFDARR